MSVKLLKVIIHVFLSSKSEYLNVSEFIMFLKIHLTIFYYICTCIFTKKIKITI